MDIKAKYKQICDELNSELAKSEGKFGNMEEQKRIAKEKCDAKRQAALIERNKEYAKIETEYANAVSENPVIPELLKKKKDIEKVMDLFKE